MRPIRLHTLVFALSTGVASLSALTGCESPSVPLPPPDLSSFLFAAPVADEVQCTAAPNPQHRNALFFFYNNSRGSGNITKASSDGSFVTDPFPGLGGDQLKMYYQATTGETSEEICAQIQFGSVLISSGCD